MSQKTNENEQRNDPSRVILPPVDTSFSILFGKTPKEVVTWVPGALFAMLTFLTMTNGQSVRFAVFGFLTVVTVCRGVYHQRVFPVVFFPA